MKSSLTTWLGFSAAAASIAIFASHVSSQPEIKPGIGSSQSNVVSPAPLAPTQDRIESLQLPEGFQIRKWAELQNPRVILAAPDGTVYVSQREPGQITMLKDTNGDGRVDVQKIVATRKQAHGLALRGNQLFFITIKEIYVANRKPDGTLTTPKLVLNNLPDAGQHPNRTIGFGPDKKMYISVGSTCNVCSEPNEENATMLQADSNGKNRKVFASGLRNTIGFGWHPTTKRFYGWDHGIDTLGDNESKEEINELKMGKRYGWPYIYENDKAIDHPKPPPAYSFEDWAKMSEEPSLMHTAHSAGIQMKFYTGRQFPDEYRNDAFVTLRGSWNRNPPSGYEVVRVKFNRAGQPTSITPFLSSFLLPEGAPGKLPGHIGRLVGLEQMPDGSLLVGDDTNNVIYRISYGAKNAGRAQTSAMDSRKISFDLSETATRGVLNVSSANFKNGGAIPFRHTAYDKNISPQISWSGAPPNTISLVLMMEDSVGINPLPFVHWLAINIPPRASGVLSGKQPETERLPSGALQGATHTGKTSYFGPKPPADGKVHQYHFQIFALDTKLKLPSGYNRQALLDAIKGHVVAKGKVTGAFKRDPY